jgi:catechol 2,3-dioxygenase-like lactoylglutathione lyase family enzyme
MIGYVTLGTNDIARAARFYDALLAELGARRVMGTEEDGFIAWSSHAKGAAVSVTKPYDGKTATVGNGVMVALAAGSKDKVDAVYRKALQLGARDEGAPGPRSPTFYAAYFRDPDGNKLNAFYLGS